MTIVRDGYFGGEADPCRPALDWDSPALCPGCGAWHVLGGLEVGLDSQGEVQLRCPGCVPWTSLALARHAT
jgi:hypothetical protein